MTIQKPYKTIIYIGRFQPFHNAHKATIEYAATLAERVIVVIGSANQPRDDANPFTQDERMMLIESSVNIPDLQFVCVENSIYSNQDWAIRVAQQVAPLIESNETTKLIGHSKDESSFYLTMFPQWGDPIEMAEVEVLDATTIRNLYFSAKNNLKLFANVVPTPVLDFMKRFMETEDYQNLITETEYIKNYRAQFAHLKYGISFQTGDAVVFKSGHVLLIKRRSAPGKGLWAIPGGFLEIEKDANVLDCAVRELYEETGIKVPEAVIRGSIKEEKVFSAKGRSRRGRVITTAQHIVLNEQISGLPKVKGQDDAEKAKWVPIATLRRQDMFEDHYDIIQYFRARNNA